MELKLVRGGGLSVRFSQNDRKMLASNEEVRTYSEEARKGLTAMLSKEASSGNADQMPRAVLSGRSIILTFPNIPGGYLPKRQYFRQVNGAIIPMQGTQDDTAKYLVLITCVPQQDRFSPYQHIRQRASGINPSRHSGQAS